MENWRKVDKERLTIFTDAIMAIIMTILVLDLKVPVCDIDTDRELKQQLIQQLPHFLGFAISFSMIVIIWFSHQNLMTILTEANRPFTVLNFLFSGSIATLPFSTALASEYPSASITVAIFAANMLLMNVFLAGMYIYIDKNKMVKQGAMPLWYKNVKQGMGLTGAIILLSAILVSFVSPHIALLMIVIVPLMHCIPVRLFKRNASIY